MEDRRRAFKELLREVAQGLTDADLERCRDMGRLISEGPISESPISSRNGEHASGRTRPCRCGLRKCPMRCRFSWCLLSKNSRKASPWLCRQDTARTNRPAAHPGVLAQKLAARHYTNHYTPVVPAAPPIPVPRPDAGPPPRSSACSCPRPDLKPKPCDDLPDALNSGDIR
jgi:hypothetical protein